MSKADFLKRLNEEKNAKKVEISGTNINVNYDAQSEEYKKFRCKVNRWQKDCRTYFSAVYGLDFSKCFRFEVLSGTFRITENGKRFLTKINEDDIKDINEEMSEMSKEFLEKVCKK